MPCTDQRPDHGRYGCRAAVPVVPWAPWLTVSSRSIAAPRGPGAVRAPSYARLLFPRNPRHSLDTRSPIDGHQPLDGLVRQTLTWPDHSVPAKTGCLRRRVLSSKGRSRSCPPTSPSSTGPTMASRTFATPSAGPRTTGSGREERRPGSPAAVAQCGPLARPLETLRPTETT